MEGRTVNISRLGAFIELTNQIPAGASIALTLEIPRYCPYPSRCGPVQCNGSVFRSYEANENGRYGAGIFFTEFNSQDHKERLSNYIDFLIQQETQSVNKGIKAWRHKREIMHRKKTPLQETREQKADFQAEALMLLGKIKEKLDEIYRLLKPPA